MSTLDLAIWTGLALVLTLLVGRHIRRHIRRRRYHRRRHQIRHAQQYIYDHGSAAGIDHGITPDLVLLGLKEDKK